MTPIEKQRNLMQDAIKTLSEIETVKSLVGSVDPITAKIIVLDLKKKYVETMTNLQLELLKANTYELA